jgi:RimJ/RimL family protein N-acetyltransferase
MTPNVHIETERLVLRDWTEADAAPFAAMNADPRVMEFFPKPLSREESDEALAGNQAQIDRNGYGKYATEESDKGRFIGYVGLAPVDPAMPFAPAMEVGWRLTRTSWGEGYATEAARAVVAHAFGTLGLPSLVSFTTEWNLRSRRVMEKIGMTRDPDGDFLHPALPPDHKLARHVLYRIRRPAVAKQERKST